MQMHIRLQTTGSPPILHLGVSLQLSASLSCSALESMTWNSKQAKRRPLTTPPNRGLVVQISALGSTDTRTFQAPERAHQDFPFSWRIDDCSVVVSLFSRPVPAARGRESHCTMPRLILCASIPVDPSD